jgi:UDP-N-acetyl-D-galactosamine dehydrogenase
VAEKTVKLLIRGKRQVRGAVVAVLGLTFKENVPDLRNTRVVDIIRELEEYGINVRVHDPLADPQEARRHYGVSLTPLGEIRNVDAAILAVMHDVYARGGLPTVAGLLHPDYPLLLDIKGAFDRDTAAAQGIHYWRL